jgi:uncharacterized protein YyaL (SSP411 family)
VRPAEVYDGAYPCGQSAAVYALLRLSKLLGREDFADTALRVLENLSGNLNRSPGAHCYLLCALDFALGPNREMVVAGNTMVARDLLRKAGQKPLFRDVLHWIRGGEAGQLLGELAPFLPRLQSIFESGTFYLCEDFSCQSPVEITPGFIEKF